MYYDIKIERPAIDEKTGEEKKKKEWWITNCDLFSEAEAAGMRYYNGHCDVFSITRSNVIECMNEQDEEHPIFYRVCLLTKFVDDDGNEREMKYYMLVCAKTLEHAHRLTTEYLNQGYDHMTLKEIKETKILGIIE